MNLIEGGPAAVAGTIAVNDRIIGVGQGKDGPLTEVIGWRLDDVVQLIRGKGATPVRLQVLPAGAAPGSPEKIIELTRGKVTLEGQAAKKEVRTVKRGDTTLRVGVINVPGFYADYKAQNDNENFRSTTHDVHRLLDELRKENVDGVVLDLRGNGGGFLPEAQSLTGLFIDQGPVVQVKVSNGETQVLDDTEPGATYTGPLAVLVDRTSASASEIFAGAIQDYHRGLILGQTTFGKGTVQSVIELDRWSSRPMNGQLHVTIGKFYRVTGESTQHRGVEPDVALASSIDKTEVGESALDSALPWDRIGKAEFNPMPSSSIPVAVGKLAQEEQSRSQRDADYKWWVSDIAAIDVLRRQKTISLSLKQRRDERTRLDQERLTRENQRRTASAQPLLKTVEELESREAPDAVLEQATEVMADMVSDNVLAARKLNASTP